jgi:hypothetical protein
LKLPLLWAKAPLAKPAPTSIPNTILISFFIMLSPFPQKCFSNPQPVDPKLALKLPLLRANDGPAASANKTAPPHTAAGPLILQYLLCCCLLMTGVYALSISSERYLNAPLAATAIFALQINFTIPQYISNVLLKTNVLGQN